MNTTTLELSQDVYFYPQLIDEAREQLRDDIETTPLHRSDYLANNVELYVKNEGEQPAGSFKIRGASLQTQAMFERGKNSVVAASAGNFARGVALSAARRNMFATVIVPESTEETRILQIIEDGTIDGMCYVEVFKKGENVNESLAIAAGLADDNLVEPYNHELAIAGHGTVGSEVFEDMPDVEKIFVTIGGGSLAAGILESLPADSKAKVCIVQLQGNDTLECSLKAGRVVEASALNKYAAGTAVHRMSEKTFRIIQKHYLAGNVEVLTVTEAEVGARIYKEDARRQDLVPGMGLENAYDGYSEVSGFVAEAGAAQLASSEVNEDGAIGTSPRKWVAIASGSTVDVNAERVMIKAFTAERALSVGSHATRNVVGHAPMPR